MCQQLKLFFYLFSFLTQFRCGGTSGHNQQSTNNPAIHTQNLLLLLPEIRLSDTVMRQFWLDIRNGKWHLDSVSGLDHPLHNGTHPINIPMKKLFVEMLDAGIEWSWK